MKNSLKYSLICWCVMLCLSCKTERSKQTPKEYSLVRQTDKVFVLDNETAYDQLEDEKIVTINNIRYYCFFNRANYSIYIYNYDTSSLYRKIQLEREGSNGIVAPYFHVGFLVHDLNTIIINTNKFIYIVNANGKIIKKAETTVESIIDDTCVQLDNTSYFEDNKLYTSLYTIVPNDVDDNPTKGVFNFDTGSIEATYLENSVLVKNHDKIIERTKKWMTKYGTVISVGAFFAKDTNTLYASSLLNDSIYAFKNAKLQKTYYASDPNVTTANYTNFLDKHETEIKHLSDESSYDGSKSTNCAYYTSMFIDPEYNWIYKILIHGTKTAIDPNTKEEFQVVRKASLVALNLSSETTKVFNIPLDVINLNDYYTNTLVSNEGIHFSIKEPENENEKRYAVYKVEQ